MTVPDSTLTFLFIKFLFSERHFNHGWGKWRMGNQGQLFGKSCLHATEIPVLERIPREELRL